MPREDVLKQIELLPLKPGVYQFFDEKGNLLYIGKAQNLRKRVASYFQKEPSSIKLKLLVSKINRIEFIVVSSSIDALILENNLIKKHQPKYNVLLRDDKTYPWIIITDEEYPRIIKTRDKTYRNAEYFGPYPSGRMMHSILNVFERLFYFRTCQLKLNEKDIQKGKFKPCISFQLKRCLAPCIGLQSHEDYLHMVQQAKKILRGNIKPVLQEIEQQMKSFAERWEFEKAQEMKEKWQLLKEYQAKSVVSFPHLGNVDVFSMIRDGEYAYVNFFRIVEGNVVYGQSIELKSRLEETNEELLLLAIGNFWAMMGENPTEVIVPFPIHAKMDHIKFVVPKKGEKLELLKLSLKNATEFKERQQKQLLQINPETYIDNLLLKVQSELNLSQKPVHIECFDISNFQGEEAVAACVVFKNGKPSKSEYRIFHIKTVTGANDFAMVKESVFRRYKRLVEEKKELPQLVIIDGGKGQLSAAHEAIQALKLQDQIHLIGIAKKLEEIFKTNDPLPLFLNKKSEVLKFIQRIRDEAHRFALKNHRKYRSQQVLSSQLKSLPGIGEKTVQKLFKFFGSLENMAKADRFTFIRHFGANRGSRIYVNIKKILPTLINEK
ncbi:MAG: excinuclease ABC subunit UvrC [Bacteroidales bacterium]|nr:excinuclease ABC subunit UvrC [Bacteroidales bacterium]